MWVPLFYSLSKWPFRLAIYIEETFARRLVYILFSRPLKVLLISDIQQISLRKPLINLQVFLSL